MEGVVMNNARFAGIGLLLVVLLFAEEKMVNPEAVAASEATNQKSTVDAHTSASPQPVKTEKGGFVVFHAVMGDNLLAQVSYKTSGWVAIGFKPEKKMKGANIIIGYAADGKSIVADHYGTKPHDHEGDSAIGGKNTINESKCREKDGVTTLWISIPLDSGDSRDVVLKKGEKVKIILAAGKKDNLKDRHKKITSLFIEL
jgi:hypothetical protein